MKRLSIAEGRRLAAVLALAAACIFLMGGSVRADPKEPPVRPGQEGLFTLPGPLPDNLPTDPAFRYDVHLDQEKFYVFVPSNYRGREPFGLIAFVNAADRMSLPPDWKGMLKARKMLFIAPQDVGNGQPVSRRLLLGIIALRKMTESYQIDPKRIYISGFSGGAKVACALAYTQPDLIRGALPICAAFLPSDVVVDGEPLLKKVKSQVGFAIITGPKDFNHQGLGVIHDRLAAEKYRVKLFDAPGMGHQLARATTLTAALNWLEGRDMKPAAKPNKPDQAKKTSAAAP
jgi:predicted esterase